MLELKNLKVNYGGIEAVKGISMEVPKGSIVTLIGANGAGKSSTLRTIAGLVRASGGQVLFHGEDISAEAPQKRVARGITLCPEGRRVFPDMTVLENIRIGAYLRQGDLTEEIENIYQLFPRLKERHWQLAGTLSGGEQQMLAVARSLMSAPEIMMLDEPSLGLAPIIVQEIFEILRRINRERGMTILLIEQNANMALKLADRAYVMETGRITMSGVGAELLENEEIREAYLGRKNKSKA